jgi:type II secretory pathway pseudopilin PulG
MTQRDLDLRKFNLASVIVGCLIALALIYLQGYSQERDERDAEAARQAQAKQQRAVEWAHLDAAGQQMTSFDRIKK